MRPAPRRCGARSGCRESPPTPAFAGARAAPCREQAGECDGEREVADGTNRKTSGRAAGHTGALPRYACKERDSLSFFDDDEEERGGRPPRASGHRIAPAPAAARAPQRGGRASNPARDRHTMMVRRRIAAGVGVVVLIVIVLLDQRLSEERQGRSAEEVQPRSGAAGRRIRPAGGPPALRWRSPAPPANRR